MAGLEIFLVLLGSYFLIGFLFSLYFVFKGVAKLDDDAKDLSLGMKLLLIPGSTAFWIFLVIKSLKKQKHE